MTTSKALPIPENADQLPGAMELVRVWSTSQGDRVALQVVVDLPVAAWGIMLADIARHAARAYSLQGLGRVNDNYREIVAQFVTEVQQPSEEPTGELRPDDAQS